MDSGVSSSDKQHILSPSTPESRHNVRGASGRFGKLSTEKKKPGAQALQKGYKIWTAKRKLSYEDCCEESEPPPKRALRSSQVSNKGCSEYLLFFRLRRIKCRIDRSSSAGLSPVDLISTNRRQQKISKEQDWLT